MWKRSQDFQDFQDPNKYFDVFIKKISGIFHTALPKIDQNVKLKGLKYSWITEELQKSSKKGESFWKVFEEQAYKNLFQNIKNNSNLLIKSKVIYYFQNNIENTWKIFETLGKKMEIK